jgi:hypothetical protein
VQEIKNLGDPGRISGGVDNEQSIMLCGVPIQALSITGYFVTHEAIEIHRDLKYGTLFTRHWSLYVDTSFVLNQVAPFTSPKSF